MRHGARLASAASLLVGCGSGAPPQGLRAGPSVEAAGAALVFAFDPDGDGLDELVRIDSARAPATLSWSGGTVPLEGVVQRGLAVPVGPGAAQTLVLATGAGPGAPAAEARLWALDARGLRALWRAEGPRAQFTELRWVDDQLFVAHFADTRSVEGGFFDLRAASPPAALSERLRAHMGMRQLPLSQGRRLVGALYGEAPKSDGGLRLYARDGQRTDLPSLRGVRALASANLDDDVEAEIIVGDGWHAEYGRSAQARLRLFDGEALDASRTIAVLDGSYAVIDVQPIGEGAGACLLATGSHAVHLLCRDRLGWADQRLGPVGETGNAAVLRGEDGVQVAISGAPCLLLPLSPDSTAR